MKICFVSAFPPSKMPLNEYGFHIAKELQADPLVSLTVVSDELSPSEPELPDFNVIRCWRMNRLSNHIQVLRALHEVKPDVVWFNLIFSSFGSKDRPFSAFSGLTLPAMTQMAGYVATRLILMSNSISVLLPAYRRTLIDKYRGEHVHFRAHGILSARPEYPDFSRRGIPEHRILGFGKWGTYKRCEMLIECFEDEISKRIPNSRLLIAGTNNGNAPGYIESLQK